MPFKDHIPAPVKRAVPNPLKQLPWRVRALRETGAFAGSPLRTSRRLAWWTMQELSRSEFSYPDRNGRPVTTMPNNIPSFMEYVAGSYEDHMIGFMKSCLRPGHVFCDVGANIGRYSIEAAQAVGPEGKVVAVEAHPEIFRFLRKNLDQNGAGNVEAVNLAAGESPGTVTLEYVSGNVGATHVTADPRSKGVRVRMARLDDELKRLGVGRLDYLKVDVEGLELPVLRGAREVIEASPDLRIQTEIYADNLRRAGVLLSDFASFMHGLGFSAHVVDERGVLEETDIGRMQYGDCVWVRRIRS